MCNAEIHCQYRNSLNSINDIDGENISVKASAAYHKLLAAAQPRGCRLQLAAASAQWRKWLAAAMSALFQCRSSVMAMLKAH